MKCPSCNVDTGSDVKDSRRNSEGIWRRRICKGCGSTFSTLEKPHEFRPLPKLLHPDLKTPLDAKSIHARRVAVRRQIEDAADLPLDVEFE